jgi:hypothetical protein
MSSESFSLPLHLDPFMPRFCSSEQVLILDPDIPLTCGFLALALPIGIHTVLANVVEPLLFGAGHGAEGTELDPTIMLISMSVSRNPPDKTINQGSTLPR